MEVIAIKQSDYLPEELVAVVAELASGYTGYEHSSVFYEGRRDLWKPFYTAFFRALLWERGGACGLSEKRYSEHRGAHTVLRAESLLRQSFFDLTAGAQGMCVCVWRGKESVG